MDSCANWLILRSEGYNQYYIYNVSTKQYLKTEGGKLVQTDEPKPISISSAGTGFRIGSLNDFYQFLDNYSMAPDMDESYNLLLESEAYVHP